MDYESRISHGEAYPLGRRLSSGTSGDVFETTHPLLPGPCAIKILRPELVSSPAVFEAFRADLEAVAALGHPNIVRVIEVGARPHAPPFVVMEMLEFLPFSEQFAAQ